MDVPPFEAAPPPASPKRRRAKRIALCVLVLGGVVVSMSIAFGLVGFWKVPNENMAPELLAGDHILAEGFTFVCRKPQRGDIVTFKATGIAGLTAGSTHVKRIAGVPGDEVRLWNGQLYVNGKPVQIYNSLGPIVYANAAGSPYLSMGGQTVTVPDGHYFVLGDNPPKSLDSRWWGFLPAGNIVGRVVYVWWPFFSMRRVR
jgi:signal peptidase I